LFPLLLYYCKSSSTALGSGHEHDSITHHLETPKKKEDDPVDRPYQAQRAHRRDVTSAAAKCGVYVDRPASYHPRVDRGGLGTAASAKQQHRQSGCGFLVQSGWVRAGRPDLTGSHHLIIARRAGHTSRRLLGISGILFVWNYPFSTRMNAREFTYKL
jgi:hypothetical protein